MLDKRLDEFVGEYNKTSSIDSDSVARLIKKYNVKKKQDQKLVRINTLEQNELPNAVIENLFEIKPKNITIPYVTNDHGYICYLKNIKHSNKASEEIKKEMHNKIAIGVIDDMIQYLEDYNNTRINIIE